MLLLNISPIYLKCGAILQHSELLIKELENYKSKFNYIHPDKIISYKNRILLLFKISYFQIEDFKNSYDFEFLKNKIKLINNYKLDEKEKKIIEENKTNNEIISETRIKSNEIQKCYYCGELTGKKEYIIYNLFQKKCIQFGNKIELTIKGINFMNNNIDNSFFTLPKKPISSVISVGEGIEKVIQKNYIQIKNNLFPFLLTTGEEGVSVYRVDSINSFQKIGENSFGPTTLLSFFTLSRYENPDLAVSDMSKGNNKLIDLSVGDIYGGSYENIGLSSNLIGSSFGKFKNVENKNVDKKDIAKSLAILYGATYSHVTAMVSYKENIDKVIISGNPFDSLELLQIIDTSIGRYSNNCMKAYFNDYLEYFEIIGMFNDLEINYKL